MPSGKFRTPLLGRLIALLLLPALAGCSSQMHVGQWFGPSASADCKIIPQTDLDPTARLLKTPHYDIYTTIDDDQLLDQIGQLMEGSLQAYHTLAPDVTLTTTPMQCYIFSKRSQWAEFTYEHTGSAARIYLQINRGGYTAGDWYVAYYIGQDATLSVSAHEGWHQFCFRHFRSRLPPFIEEGLATMFEGVQFRNGLPVFNLSVNLDRAIALRHAMDNGDMWSLDEVIGMNAGQVVGRPNAKIMSWYAQAWGFGRFLWDGDDQSHRAALQRMLADCATGDLYDPTGRRHTRLTLWTPESARGMLEHYLGMSWDQIEDNYDQFIRHVADDELPNEDTQPW